MVDDPALLYNIAQARRLAGNTKEALRSYKTFLRLVPNATNRAEVESRVVELQAAIDQQAKAQTAKPDGTIQPLPEQQQQPSETKTAETVPPSKEPPKEEAPPRPWYRDTVAMSFAGVGAASLLAGIGLAAGGAVVKGQSDRATDLGDRQRLYHDASVYSITGYALLGAGVVCGVGAIVTWSIHRKHNGRGYALAATPGGSF
jgi:hypothetical protein